MSIQSRAQTAIPALWDSFHIHEAANDLLKGAEEGIYTFSAVYLSGRDARTLIGGLFFLTSIKIAPEFRLPVPHRLAILLSTCSMIAVASSPDQNFQAKGMRNLVIFRTCKEAVLLPEMQKKLGRLRIVNLALPVSDIERIDPSNRKLPERISRIVPTVFLAHAAGVLGDKGSAVAMVNPIILDTVASENASKFRRFGRLQPQADRRSFFQKAGCLGGGLIGCALFPTPLGGFVGVVTGSALGNCLSRMIEKCKGSWDRRCALKKQE